MKNAAVRNDMVHFCQLHIHYREITKTEYDSDLILTKLKDLIGLGVHLNITSTLPSPIYMLPLILD